MAEDAISLSFHVLNVGHGSSVVIEHTSSDSGRVFGIIDSNNTGTASPAVLTKLKELGCDRLSFVCLTHPHADHYRGIKDVLKKYDGKIAQFFAFPMGNILTKRERLIRWAKALDQLRNRSDDQEKVSASEELLWIIRWADQHRTLWTECDGDESRIAPEGFSDIEIHTILPPRRAKGTYLNVIDTLDPMAFGSARENEVSLAIKFKFRDQVVVFGGDGDLVNWNWRRDHYEKTSKTKIAARAVNLPHHGSARDCSDAVLSQLFTDDDGQTRYAISSANGQSHPSIDMIESLQKMGVHPYCTNLLPECGAGIRALQPLQGIDPELARWLREVTDTPGHVQPCQGDVTVTIDHTGRLSITPEFPRPCGFRGSGGDYQGLFEGF